MLNASIGETYSNFWGGMDEEVITKYLKLNLRNRSVLIVICCFLNCYFKIRAQGYKTFRAQLN